jgi:Predicted permease
MRYMLPVIIPFLLAYLIVRLISPLIEKLYLKYKISKGFSASVIILGIVGVLSFLLRLGLLKVIQFVKYFITHIGKYEQSVYSVIDDGVIYLQKITGLDTYVIERFVGGYVDKIITLIKNEILPNVMNDGFHYLKAGLGVFAIVAITFVSVILLAKDYEHFKEVLRSSVYYKSVGKICSRVLKSGGVYLKAQCIIMAIIGGICVSGLFILKNPYAIFVGILIGLLDSLPVIGTGTIFIPWALVKFFQGDYFYGSAYLIIWGITWLTREFLEPKFIGKKLGLYPIAIVMTMYIGINIYGIAGIVLGPLSLLFILEIVREVGVLKDN